MTALVERRSLRLRLPATSANLGPGFDAVGLALSLWLTVTGEVAEGSAGFSIEAAGRDAALCGVVERNLILETYRGVMEREGEAVLPLQLKIANEIPLGMGCGSSAAAICAGVALANHFGGLGMDDAAMVTEASRIEGHPDNVAACWYGGFTVSGVVNGRVERATFVGDGTSGTTGWRMLLAMQASSLATTKARAMLPGEYSKADAVFNVQRVALLVAAFAQGRLELLQAAMADRMHQPYRMEACPLLGRLLPLADDPMLAGVALSGAGPSVLLVLAAEASVVAVEAMVRGMAGLGVEMVEVRVAGGVERTVV